MALGLSEDEFWRRTPRQIACTFEAWGIKLRREHNERMSLAWHIVALGRTSPKKKLPSLRSLLSRERAKVPQSWQQQLAIAKQWTVLLGGQVVKKPKAD